MSFDLIYNYSPATLNQRVQGTGPCALVLEVITILATGRVNMNPRNVWYIK